jgi:uncharacterized protein
MGTMISLESIRARREEILTLGKRYGASNFRVFGSVARGDSNQSSDVDLLVQFEPGRSLFDHGGLLMDLRDLLGVKVDIISEAGLHGRWRDYLQEEGVPL